MKLVVGSDHAAFQEKQRVVEYLKEKYDAEVIDVGPASADRCNYPDYAIALSKRVRDEDIRGVLLCGSGIGVSMVANRFKGVRAALCRNVEEAQISRQHNDSNVLCLGARISSWSEITSMIDAWISADFEEGRHSERISIFNDMGI